MLNEQISELMHEVRDVADSMERGTEDWHLMLDAHSALRLASSLIHIVNTRQLYRLMNGN